MNVIKGVIIAVLIGVFIDLLIKVGLSGFTMTLKLIVISACAVMVVDIIKTLFKGGTK